ncbi:MAG TPA: OB-fold nucleic acid binding domain-containing protein, partial [Candidatus Nanoarchaeia archaeon]|nr:OB-fold nucleic acid binding domain-containing protein [Candidatus Nanoarchaeia archaeon]
MKYEDIVARIRQQKNISHEEIEERVKGKLQKLSDLLSREGAAHIVANELGVKLFDDLMNRQLKISDLIGGMRAVTIAGKVTKVGNVIAYKKETREGKVANLFIADASGKIRVVLWDAKQIKLVEDGMIKEGDVIKVTKSTVRANQGFTEIHLNSFSEIFVNPPGVTMPEISDKQQLHFIDKKIQELKEQDDQVAITGTIVQAFEPRFYPGCPQCAKKAFPEGEQYRCAEHGVVAADFIPVLNLFFDDGTDSIRVVAFRNQAERILGMSKEETQKFKEDPASFEACKQQLLGKQFKFIGKVTKNEMAGRNEFTTRFVLDL